MSDPHYTIYHCETLGKCGCTGDFEGRQSDPDYEGHILYPLSIMPKSEYSAKEAGDEEWWWADYYQYPRGRHYLQSVANPKRTKAISEGMKELWQDPEYQQKQSDAQKELWQDLDYQQRQSEAQKERWQDPEYQQKQSEALSKGMTERFKDPLTCPYCGFVGRGPNMYKHHFNNCKKKPLPE